MYYWQYSHACIHGYLAIVLRSWLKDLAHIEHGCSLLMIFPAYPILVSFQIRFFPKCFLINKEAWLDNEFISNRYNEHSFVMDNQLNSEIGNRYFEILSQITWDS